MNRAATAALRTAGGVLFFAFVLGWLGPALDEQTEQPTPPPAQPTTLEHRHGGL